MQAREKISKSSWTLVEGVKDAVTSNVTNAVRNGQVKMETAQLDRLLNLLGASVDEGFQRGHKSFMKTVELGLEEAYAEGEEVAMPVLASGPKSPKVSSKKK